MKKSNGDELLAGCYHESDPVDVAMGAHCHLLNVIRAFRRKLPWKLELPDDLAIKAHDSEGRL